MIIGAGPIVIGQACEFDYSGAGRKTLRAEGYRIVPGEFEPGDDHDRSGHGGPHLCRADHAGSRRQDHREGALRDPRRLCAVLPTMGDRPR